MTRNISTPDFHNGVYQSNFWDDFYELTDTQKWVITDADAGATVTNPDGVDGRILLTTGATDNNEAYLASTREIWKMQAGCDIEAVCRVSFAEANTDDLNFLFGLMSGVGGSADNAGDALVDDGGGPAASKDQLLIWKVDGGTVWKCGSSLAAATNPANTSTESAGQTNSETSGFQTLLIKAQSVSSDELRVTYHVDPRGLGGFRQLKDSNGNLIEDTITISGATEMNVIFGAKAGSANSETPTVDYVGVFQGRQAAVGGV